MSKGLGDMVEQVMNITGIKKIVGYFFQDCGCDERHEWLNSLPAKLLKLPKEYDCLTKQEYLYLSGVFELKQKDFDILEQRKLIDILNKIYRTNLKTCSSCGISNLLKPLKRLYKSYHI